jgi:hypothetical protein
MDTGDPKVDIPVISKMDVEWSTVTRAANMYGSNEETRNTVMGMREWPNTVIRAINIDRMPSTMTP